MTLNGALGGLVGITAGADQMGALSAFIIGLLAGCLVAFAVTFFDKRKIDDPVGAISVHLVCGVWGTLAVGLFGSLASFSQFLSQLIGVACVGSFAFGGSYLFFSFLKKTVGVRVSEHDEKIGLDLSEHGCTAYRGVRQIVLTKKKEEANQAEKSRIQKAS